VPGSARRAQVHEVGVGVGAVDAHRPQPSAQAVAFRCNQLNTLPQLGVRVVGSRDRDCTRDGDAEWQLRRPQAAGELRRAEPVADPQPRQAVRLRERSQPGPETTKALAARANTPTKEVNTALVNMRAAAAIGAPPCDSCPVTRSTSWRPRGHGCLRFRGLITHVTQRFDTSPLVRCADSMPA